ncbi:MAG: multiheme c-type cytochrome, partial [Azonexus sp.]
MPRAPRRRFVSAALVLAVLVAGAALLFVSATPTPPASSPSVVAAVAPDTAPGSVPATYVGAESCKTCHESEFKAWSGSHHQLAMQEATATSVLGDFADAKFRKDGVESTFFKRGDRFMVRTDGPDGKLADYEVAYTFGLYPLQQYLIPFPGGRYQALPIAWDSRPKSEGGQRWFHLYPKQKTDYTDPLHWTGVYH